MFVSLAILKLVEEGKLSLNDKLSDLAPEIEFENPWEKTNPIRVVNLLEHTTGWDDIHLPEFASSEYPPLTLKEGLDFHPHSRVSRWQPGSRMSYCNAGPPVAAYIIEKVTGQEFEQYVAENFFTPMGMEGMTYRLSEDVRAKGVTLYAYGNKPQPYWHIIVRPSGSINASPKDMARLLEFFVNRGAVGGQQLISTDSLARMESVASTGAAAAGQEAGYGLSNYSSSHKSWVYRGHNGGVAGGLTEFAYLPEANAGHAIMINSEDSRTLEKINELVRDFETRNLPPAMTRATVSLTVEHKAIEGLYYPINARQEAGHFLFRILGVQRLWFDNEWLVRKPLLGGESERYFPVSPDLYAAKDSGITSLSRVLDPLDGNVVHAGMEVLVPTSELVIYGQLSIVALWALSIVTSGFYFIVWGVRKLRGKIPSGPTMRIRLWPLLASVSVGTFVGGFMFGMADPFVRLGGPTFVSIVIMLSTIAFALFAVLGIRTSVRERHAAMSQVNYWYCTATSVIHALVATYLFWFGAVGLMTWA
jgi:CubicO group peptidase (beta-lactamase class C family)